MKTATTFCMVIKLDERKIFAASVTPPVLAKKIFDTNADARSVCGS